MVKLGGTHCGDKRADNQIQAEMQMRPQVQTIALTPKIDKLTLIRVMERMKRPGAVCL